MTALCSGSQADVQCDRQQQLRQVQQVPRAAGPWRPQVPDLYLSWFISGSQLAGAAPHLRFGGLRDGVHLSCVKERDTGVGCLAQQPLRHIRWRALPKQHGA